jgi:hypothetical protein
MSIINQFIGTALMYTMLPQCNAKVWKEELREQWRNSMLLPRKKKKAARKRIMCDWKIACWMDVKFTF